MKLCNNLTQIIGGVQIDFSSVFYGGHVVISLLEFNNGKIDIEIQGIPCVFYVTGEEGSYGVELSSSIENTSDVLIFHCFHRRDSDTIEFDFYISKYY